MPQPIIRDATPADAEGLVPLLDTLGYPANASTIAERLSKLLAQDPSARVLVAAEQQTLLGFATLHATPVLHRPTPVGRITALAVTKGDRGAGVGRALVEAAEAHFAEQGWLRLEVTSGPMHAGAHPFYRHLGYEDQGIRFAKILPS